MTAPLLPAKPLTRRRTAPLTFALLVTASLTRPALGEEEVVLEEEGNPPAAAAPKPAGGNQPVVEDNAGIMVRPFEGPKSQTVHDRVISTLEAEGIILIPEGFEEGVKLAEAPGPYIEVARKNQIKAYLHGQTKMTKRAWTVTLKVRNAADGKPVSSVTLTHYSLPGLLKKIDKELMGVLDEPLLKTSVPGAKGSKPSAAKGGKPSTKASKAAAAESNDDEGAMAVTLEAEPESGGDVAADTGPIAPKEERSRDGGQPPSPLDASLGVGVLQRNMNYQTPVGDIYEHGLQPHTMMVPALRIGANWYPGAYLYDGVPANIGLAVNVYQSVGGNTEVNNPNGTSTDLSTSFTEVRAGLRGRIHFPNVELGLNGGWGFASLKLDGDNEKTPTNELGDPGVVPDFAYTFFRFGPDVHIEYGTPIHVGLFYRMVALDDTEGYLAEPRWFPNAEAIGIDAFAAFNIEITKDLDLQIGGELRYYGIKANPGSYDENTEDAGNSNPGRAAEPGLTRAVAAGVSDLYLGAFVSGYYTVPGTPH